MLLVFDGLLYQVGDLLVGFLNLLLDKIFQYKLIGILPRQITLLHLHRRGCFEILLFAGVLLLKDLLLVVILNLLTLSNLLHLWLCNLWSYVWLNCERYHTSSYLHSLCHVYVEIDCSFGEH